MKVVSLFSGIGGLDLGLENAGHEIILQVESDPHCIRVRRHVTPVYAYCDTV
jgi:site-specific DNA-cytosine methylase